MTSATLRILAGLAVLTVCAGPITAWAQSPIGFGGGGGHRSHRGQGGRQPSAQAPTAPRLIPDPWPRLDAGALLCESEPDLQRHQLAVEASLGGAGSPTLAGCRLVRAMTPVTIVARHGLARTEVRLPGPPEQIGWTDALLPERPPSH